MLREPGMHVRAGRGAHGLLDVVLRVAASLQIVRRLGSVPHPVLEIVERVVERFGVACLMANEQVEARRDSGPLRVVIEERVFEVRRLGLRRAVPERRLERGHARRHLLAARRGEIRPDERRHPRVERARVLQAGAPQRRLPVVLRPPLGHPERRLVLLARVVERAQRGGSDALHVPHMEVLVRRRGDAGEQRRCIGPYTRVLDLRGVQMLHPVAAGKADVEQERVLLERWRPEDGILVAHDPFDVVHEALACAGRRGDRPVVVHHDAVLPVVDDEGIEQQRSGRCHLGGRVDQQIVVRKLKLPLARLGDRPIHDRPPLRRLDAE